MKFNEDEFIPSFSAQEIADLKAYAKKHGYMINWRERLICDIQGCHKAYLMKGNDGHINAVSNGIKEDITSNIFYSNLIEKSLNKISNKNQNSLLKQVFCGEVFGLVSLIHSNPKEDPSCQ